MNNEQNNFSKKLGESIKYHRKLAHLSQEELANKLGYRNKASIAKIEAGQTRMKAIKNSRRGLFGRSNTEADFKELGSLQI